MFWVYIIYSSKLNRYYVGHTSDLDKRIVEHNTGISSYTSKASDWELKYQTSYSTREEARKEEMRIKGRKSRSYIEKLIASK